MTLSTQIISIGNNAFNTCPSLTMVILPSSLTTIGQQSFNSCSQLTSFSNQFTVTSNTITSNANFILSYVNNISNVLAYNISAVTDKYSFLTNADQMNNGIRQQFIIDNIYANNLGFNNYYQLCSQKTEEETEQIQQF